MAILFTRHPIKRQRRSREPLRRNALTVKI